MHVPAFLPEHRLADWPDCTLEIVCGCGRTSCPAVRLLHERYGNVTFASVARKLRCSACGARPAPVYLVAGRHRAALGAPADWAVLLVRGPV